VDGEQRERGFVNVKLKCGGAHYSILRIKQFHAGGEGNKTILFYNIWQ
jgi:hypothetical protein